MKILLMHESVMIHDAIGNDIEQMFFILQQYGECYVYAEIYNNGRLTYIEETEARRIVSFPENVVIYHHSYYWEKGEKLLSGCSARLVFRYHNVTPEAFFKDYCGPAYFECKMGRKQTVRLQKKFPESVWISASKFNDTDIKYMEKGSRYICPPFNKLYEWNGIILDENVLQSLQDSSVIKLLFVGRIAPNKGHKMLFETLKVYVDNYGDDIHINIIGKFNENFSLYNDELYQMIDDYGLEPFVTFVAEVTDEILASYYIGSDFFVCASEHEGFCVPVIEAQFFGLPVISVGISALPDTGGEGQICVEPDRRKIAAAISVLNTNKDYYNFIREKGFQNIREKQSYEVIKDRFIHIWNSIIGEDGEL